MSRLNIDKMTTDSDSLLGPAPRLLLWLHGCNRNCPGCIAVDWNTSSSAQYSLSVETIANLVNTNDELEGITISGGEPFLQAESLCTLVTKINKGIIIYSGYTLEELGEMKSEAVSLILRRIDVLIDGRYIEELNDDLPFRGSSNQRIHLFSDRYREYYSTVIERRTITMKKDGFLYLYGIPNKKARNEWLSLKESINKGGKV